MLATDGLCYLLGRYPAAQHAVVTALTTDTISRETRKKISFASQTRGEGDTAIVDLEGQVGGQVFLSIEGKFGAPLQPSQPTDYARRLEPGGSLLFVCPSWRSSRLVPGAPGAIRWGAALGRWRWLEAGRPRNHVDHADGAAAPRDHAVGHPFGRSQGPPRRDAAGLRFRCTSTGGLVARFEQDLMPWTARELKSGAAGLAFAKALLTTRELCGAVADQLGSATTPSWRTFASTARTASDVEDWYGTVIPVAGALLHAGLMPLAWGEDGVPTPLRLWIFAGDLSREAVDSLYPAYLQILEISNGLLLAMLDAPPVSAAAGHERWWMVPFPSVRTSPARKPAEISGRPRRRSWLPSSNLISAPARSKGTRNARSRAPNQRN